MGHSAQLVRRAMSDDDGVVDLTVDSSDDESDNEGGAATAASSSSSSSSSSSGAAAAAPRNTRRAYSEYVEKSDPNLKPKMVHVGDTIGYYLPGMTVGDNRFWREAVIQQLDPQLELVSSIQTPLPDTMVSIRRYRNGTEAAFPIPGFLWKDFPKAKDEKPLDVETTNEKNKKLYKRINADIGAAVAGAYSAGFSSSSGASSKGKSSSSGAAAAASSSSPIPGRPGAYRSPIPSKKETYIERRKAQKMMARREKARKKALKKRKKRELKKEAMSGEPMPGTKFPEPEIKDEYFVEQEESGGAASSSSSSSSSSPMASQKSASRWKHFPKPSKPSDALANFVRKMQSISDSSGSSSSKAATPRKRKPTPEESLESQKHLQDMWKAAKRMREMNEMNEMYQNLRF